MAEVTKKKLVPSVESLAREKLSFVQNSINDPVLTPFAKALISEGYFAKCHEKSGCVLLKVCTKCKETSLHTFIKGEKEIELCPYCRNAADSKEAAH